MGPVSFSLHKRGSRYYVQFWNEKTKRYSTARSTGATTKNAATGIVMRWLDEGIPFESSTRSLTQALNTNTLFDLLNRVDLTTREADRIVEILSDRSLLFTSEDKDEAFIPWLLSFWGYETSYYVADKLRPRSANHTAAVPGYDLHSEEPLERLLRRKDAICNHH
jgi:hypothetical protein